MKVQAEIVETTASPRLRYLTVMVDQTVTAPCAKSNEACSLRLVFLSLRDKGDRQDKIRQGAEDKTSVDKRVEGKRVRKGTTNEKHSRKRNAHRFDNRI